MEPSLETYLLLIKLNIPGAFAGAKSPHLAAEIVRMKSQAGFKIRTRAKR